MLVTAAGQFVSASFPTTVTSLTGDGGVRGHGTVQRCFRPYSHQAYLEKSAALTHSVQLILG